MTIKCPCLHLPQMDALMKKSLYFIRHGQSLANTGARSMPDAEIPLTDL